MLVKAFSATTLQQHFYVYMITFIFHTKQINSTYILLTIYSSKPIEYLEKMERKQINMKFNRIYVASECVTLKSANLGCYNLKYNEIQKAMKYDKI